MTQYNIYQLKQYANKFLNDNYGINLSVPLRLNGRMKTTCGWFKHGRGKNQPIVVELNKFFVENNEPILVLDVLRHELVHYAMYMQNRDYKDGSYGFERELKRLGIVSQRTIDKYDIASKPKSVHVYQCANCGKNYHRGKCLPNGGRGYFCGIKSCKGHLIDKGKRLVTS